MSKTFLLLTTIMIVYKYSIASNLKASAGFKENEKIEIIKREEARIINALKGSSMTSLSIEAGELDEASLKFGCLNNFYSFTTRGKFQDFVITYLQKPINSINKDNDLIFFSRSMVTEKGVNFTGDLKYRGVPQWKLVVEEDFSEIPSGWTNNTISECGGVSMLGGYCKFSRGEVQKNFENLPPHKNVRIEATYHFIDAWDSEAGFMRINNGKNREMNYIWVERYSAFIGNNGINVCGGRWPEGKFSSPIDVTIPHTENSIKLGFGATIEQDPCDESFGISGLRIYVK